MTQFLNSFYKTFICIILGIVMLTSMAFLFTGTAQALDSNSELRNEVFNECDCYYSRRCRINEQWTTASQMVVGLNAEGKCCRRTSSFRKSKHEPEQWEAVRCQASIRSNTWCSSKFYVKPLNSNVLTNDCSS